MEKIYIGVAWPYANGPLHLGHMCGAYLPADIFARFNRIKGNEVLMVSGSDQHGTPITITAEKKGKIPEEIAEYYHKIHVKDLKRLGISFDLFTKTTTENHTRVVQGLFRTLYDNGYIYPKKVQVLYCPVCKRYLPDRYVEGTCPFCGNKNAKGDQCDECGKTLDPVNLTDPRCKICGSIPKIRESEHLFLKLSAFTDRLSEWVEKNNHWRASVRKFTKKWLANGLRDRAISRDLSWGIPVPVDGFEDKTIYVWFDAVTGYLSASIEWAKIRGDKNLWKEFWKDEKVKHYYFIAKDNIPFHSIIWPAMLMGYGGLNLPYQISANEFLKLGKDQFSKSTGVCIWVQDCLSALNPDVLRYCLTVNMPETKDSECKPYKFIEYNNSELVGNLGNLIHRILTFTHKNFGSVPRPGPLIKQDEELLERIDVTFKEVGDFIQNCHFKRGLKSIMDLAQTGNKYFDQASPWKLIKSDRERCGTVLYCTLRLTKAISIMLEPYLPFTSEKIWKLIGYEGNIGQHRWNEALTEISPGQKLRKPKILFKKLDFCAIFEHPFGNLDLRLAKIVSVEAHPNADKLWIVTADLGMLGQRQLIAGLKPYYSREQLLNQWIVVLTNLEPRKLRGYQSEGMMLAAQDGEKVSFLTLDGKGQPGDQITVDGIMPQPKTLLGIQDFQQVELTIDDKGLVMLEGKALRTKEGKIKTSSRVKAGSKIC
ncbi:MAG TPA: methionine--tRNA ligase [Thermoplasmata archaeon]|nr:methionine--tRNA ligase [Thermoplasmata archaeon]